MTQFHWEASCTYNQNSIVIWREQVPLSWGNVISCSVTFRVVIDEMRGEVQLLDKVAIPRQVRIQLVGGGRVMADSQCDAVKGRACPMF